MTIKCGGMFIKRMRTKGNIKERCYVRILAQSEHPFWF